MMALQQRIVTFYARILDDTISVAPWIGHARTKTFRAADWFFEKGRCFNSGRFLWRQQDTFIPFSPYQNRCKKGIQRKAGFRGKTNVGDRCWNDGRSAFLGTFSAIPPSLASTPERKKVENCAAKLIIQPRVWEKRRERGAETTKEHLSFARALYYVRSLFLCSPRSSLQFVLLAFCK